MNLLSIAAALGRLRRADRLRDVQARPGPSRRNPEATVRAAIIVIILGYGDVTSGPAMKPIVITLTVIGGALSLELGLLRGRADQVSDRDGSPFIKWGAASLILFVGNLVAKLVLDLIGIAAGGSTSAVEKALLLAFGLTLLGEVFVVWMRTGGTTGLLDPLRATTAQPCRPSTERFVDVTQPLEPSTSDRLETTRSVSERDHIDHPNLGYQNPGLCNAAREETSMMTCHRRRIHRAVRHNRVAPMRMRPARAGSGHWDTRKLK
jgi:hypothetical protein